MEAFQPMGALTPEYLQREILDAHAGGGQSVPDLSRRFDLPRSTVRLIVNRGCVKTAAGGLRRMGNCPVHGKIEMPCRACEALAYEPFPRRRSPAGR